MRGTGAFLGMLLTGAVLVSMVLTGTQALADDNDRAVTALLLKAGAAEQRSRLDDAIAAYSGIIKLRPADADAWRDRGVIQAAKKDYAAAGNDFSQAIRLQPKDARAYMERGKVYAGAGQFESALADFDEALHLNPDYVGALAAKAAVYDYQRNYDGAIATMNQLLKLQPQNPELFNGRCWERALANRELKIAEADCTTALRLSQNPGFAAAVHDSRAFVYYREGRFAEAVAEYNVALAAAPRSAETLFRRGLAKNSSKDTAGGKSDIAQALSLDPHAGDEMASRRGQVTCAACHPRRTARRSRGVREGDPGISTAPPSPFIRLGSRSYAVARNPRKLTLCSVGNDR
jgi:tetratricopeptide (TPR) repeat protein